MQVVPFQCTTRGVKEVVQMHLNSQHQDCNYKIIFKLMFLFYKRGQTHCIMLLYVTSITFAPTNDFLTPFPTNALFNFFPLIY